MKTPYNHRTSLANLQIQKLPAACSVLKWKMWHVPVLWKKAFCSAALQGRRLLSADCKCSVSLGPAPGQLRQIQRHWLRIARLHHHRRWSTPPDHLLLKLENIMNHRHDPGISDQQNLALARPHRQNILKATRYRHDKNKKGRKTLTDLIVKERKEVILEVTQVSSWLSINPS